MIKLQELTDRIYETVQSHRLAAEGEYSRYLWQNEKGDRKMGLNEYGCADAVNILYSINKFPDNEESRRAHYKTLQSMQDRESGLFREDTHHPIHTTAHCVAALELFDQKPLYPLKALMKYANVNGLRALLDGLDWKNTPWPQAHKGAGIYAALKLTDSVGAEWEEAYFEWLWENADPECGFWKKGEILSGDAEMFEYMGGGFHYLFNIEYAKQKIAYPEKIIDTCLDLYSGHKIGSKRCGYDSDKFGQYIGFLEVDWTYCLTRALRQSGYRRSDIMQTLHSFAADYTDWLYSVDYKTHDGFNDLHMLFGTVCALAELQTALPGELKTDKPLRLVLDRRPFI